MPESKFFLCELLGQSFGQNKTPLYVIHANDVGDFNEAYGNHHNRITKCVSHTDPAFKSYNGDVFSILVQYTENCEGISIVQSNERRRNDRKAWKEFQSHFEDTTYKRRSAQEAGSILKSASYSGLKKHSCSEITTSYASVLIVNCYTLRNP